MASPIVLDCVVSGVVGVCTYQALAVCHSQQLWALMGTWGAKCQKSQGFGPHSDSVS